MEIASSEALVVLEFSSRRGIPEPGQSLTNSGFQGDFDSITAEVNGSIVPSRTIQHLSISQPGSGDLCQVRSRNHLSTGR
jgi:hypothetical protein